MRKFALLVFQFGLISLVGIGAWKLTRKVFPLETHTELVNGNGIYTPKEDILYQRSQEFDHIFERGDIPKIKVETREGYEYVHAEKITCLKKEERDVHIYYLDSGSYSVIASNTNLKDFEDRLNNIKDHKFYRLKQVILNMVYIKKISGENKTGSSTNNYIYTIYMEDGNELPLPKDKKNDLLQKLDELIF